MSKNKCIFFFGITRFDAPVESTSYTLAKELAKNGNRVYYIEYPFTLSDKIKYGKTPEFKLRQKALSGNFSGIIESGVPNLCIVALPTVLSIHFLPEGKLYRTLLKYNETIIAKQLRRIIENHSLRDIIYINSFVFHYPNLTQYFHPKLSIYHCVDPVFTPYDAKHGIVSEKLIIDQSDLVICTSQQLYREKSRVHAKTYFVPNAANIDHSIQATDPHLSVHEGLSNISKPIVGYFGNIERRIDYELMREVASKNPDISFVFAGPMERELVPDFFLSIPNIHFTGRVAYDQMPSMLKGFDVAIIPFKKTPESTTVFPLKLFEYLGAGKPVVSTDFNLDLKSFTDNLVSYCSNADTFSTSIKQALNNDTPALKQMRIELAGHHTWEKRTEEFEKIIEQQLETEPTSKCFEQL
jgi:teichuronic acid biosynthesis glycosyltransferase TuaH